MVYLEKAIWLGSREVVGVKALKEGPRLSGESLRPPGGRRFGFPNRRQGRNWVWVGAFGGSFKLSPFRKWDLVPGTWGTGGNLFLPPHGGLLGTKSLPLVWGPDGPFYYIGCR